MPDLPALPLGTPEIRARTTRASARPTLQGPGSDRQRERIGPAITRISAAFEADRVRTTNQPSANPEQVLVLEVAGELTDFAKAIARVPGLEFLVEAAQERVVSGDEFAAVDRDGKQHRYDRQLYVVVSDSAAWRELLGLWARFQRGEKMPYGKAPFMHLFSRLENLRAWDDRDRLERTGALLAWEREVQGLPDELIDFEIELWLRRDTAKREAAVELLREDLAQHGGSVVSDTVREEINYHGVLARVPASKLADAVASHEIRWLRTGFVRFFRAVGQFAATAPHDGPLLDDTSTSQIAERPLPPNVPPRLAVLDGVPLAGHVLLAGRISLDDPDEWEAVTTVASRNHGTAMTSLVIHGDLNRPSDAQTAPVYVRPILWDQTPDWVGGGREELPRDKLAVDVLQSAIARLFEGDEPTAPNVRVVVLALGDAVCQFDRFVSPLARLLDWLQARFGILVLVSAGNHLGDLQLGAEADLTDAHELQHEVICALQRETGLRRLLSPAESVNALTVGASHDDGTRLRDDDGRVEPFTTPNLANMSSALGTGVRGSVKPDVLLPGGRQLVTLEPSAAGDPQRISLTATRRPPGVRVAAPGRSGELDNTTYDTGTSPATGLAGHHAGHLLDSFDELRQSYGPAMPGAEFDAVLVKAAIVHGSKWGSAKPFIDQATEEVGSGRARDLVTRMIGYGRTDPSNVLRCDDHRATAIAARQISAGSAHAYSFPLPPSLAVQTERRRLTVTLAWLTPINPAHHLYRRAALIVEPNGMPARLVERDDVDQHSARRGTVQHDVLSGTRAVPYAPGESIEFLVSCRADAGDLAVPVPYAIFVTLEVPETSALRIYPEIQQGLRVPIPVRG